MGLLKNFSRKNIAQSNFNSKIYQSNASLIVILFPNIYIMKTIEYNIRNIFTKHLIVLKLKYLIK